VQVGVGGVVQVGVRTLIFPPFFTKATRFQLACCPELLYCHKSAGSVQVFRIVRSRSECLMRSKEE
jgi:hypothetical protein